jgi:hypothetical protein
MRGISLRGIEYLRMLNHDAANFAMPKVKMNLAVEVVSLKLGDQPGQLARAG